MLTRNDIQKINQDKSAVNGRIYTDIFGNNYKGLGDGTVIIYYPQVDLGTRTLTINGTSQDLSLDRTWNVGTITSIGTTGLISGGTITGSGTITTSMNTNKLVGRGTAGTGIMEEITLGTNLSLTGTTLNAASPIGAVLSKTDDTNVTLTLGGSPTTSLLAATSLTLGWTGKLALSRFVQGTTGTVLQGVTSSDSIYTSSPTISTSVTTPLIIGGTGTGSDLILQSTSGNGNDTSWVITKAGNDGSVEVSRQGVALSPDGLATGGTITTDGGYTIHTFTTSGTFTPSGNLNVDYLIVAGGGGGGTGSGGGAGGFITGSTSVIASAYTITVGSGGSALSNGSDSSFNSVVATGGGHGVNRSAVGANGGSGGGGAGNSLAGGTGILGQGTSGGTSGPNSGYYGTGGGGGALTPGGNGSSSSGGAGGNGKTTNISGTLTTYAGGGGGGSDANPGAGGSGGGGNGVIYGTGGSGAPNTGGGGGGSSNNTGGAGGSGIVIIRYLTPSTTKRPVFGINKSAPLAQLHIGAGLGNQYTQAILLDPGVLLSTPIAGSIEYATASNDDLWFTINTGASRKGFIFNNGTNLTSGKIPIASTNGRLIDGQTPLSGTKVYYVADSSGGAVTRKLTFINGILTSET